MASTGVKPTAARRRTRPSPEPPPTRIQIQYPTPSVDGGRYPAKRCAGDTVRVEADVFRDGHDLLRAVVRSEGVTALVATHDPAVAARADQHWRMRDGQLAARA